MIKNSTPKIIREIEILWITAGFTVLTVVSLLRLF